MQYRKKETEAIRNQWVESNKGEWQNFKNILQIYYKNNVNIWGDM